MKVENEVLILEEEEIEVEVEGETLILEERSDAAEQKGVRKSEQKEG
jgi:hypothetical protein